MRKKPLEEPMRIEGESLRAISIGDRNSRSKVAEEIIHSTPDFIEKYGLAIFVFFLLLLFAFTWFIPYPDVVRGKALIIATNRSLYARVLIPQKELSKVDTGMKVELQLDAFPYQEYGVVTGSLRYIPDSISEEGCYTLARLDEGKKTDFMKAIAYKDGLTGTAIVIVRKKRLFQQLYNIFPSNPHRPIRRGL